MVEDKGFRKGSYQLNRQDDIIEFVAYGQWNDKTALQWLKDMDELLVSMDGCQWATLIDVREWQLGTPEFQSIIEEATVDHVNRGLRREAYIIDESQAKAFQIDSMMPQDSLYIAKYFHTYMEALSWLNDEGFGMG